MLSGFAVVNLAILTIIGTLASLGSYILMRRKFLKEVEAGKARERELSKRIYESEVLREISEKIGYSLNTQKIIEIIIGSLNKLLTYSAVSYLSVEENGKIKFYSNAREAVGKSFIGEVKSRMMAAFSQMTREPLLDSEIEDAVGGIVTEEDENCELSSYFNIPIVVLGKVVAIINVASTRHDEYDEKTTDVLYRIAKHGSQAVTRLLEIMENEKGRLTQAVESLSDGLLMVDNEFRLVLINKRLCHILNVGHQATLMDVVHALSGKLDIRTMMEAASNFEDEKIKPTEIAVGNYYLQVYATRVVDQKTLKPMGLVVSFHDMTDAKSLERLRSEFMAVMVHELRAPLTTIKSTVELIDEDPSLMSPQELKHHLEVIESTSQSMLELVNDLLDVAKLEAGKFEVVSEDGDLSEIIYERVEAFRPVAEAKNLKLIVTIDNDLPTASFDKTRMRQVLNNLLSNSIKYTQAGQITVKATSELVDSQPVDILVTVADTGIGIEKDDRDKLFSKFGQLKSGIKQAELKSSGLGLFIAKGIIEAIGGKIWVESAGPGLGSSFYFTVPLGNTKEEHEKPIVFSTKRVAQA